MGPLIDDNQYLNIGDWMTARGISWNWYWAAGTTRPPDTPDRCSQYHHQPFNYFAAYAPGQLGRAHLQDDEFVAAAQNGTLPQVSFVKPYGAENEHPGYASESDGSDHLVDLLQTIMSGPQAKDTVVVTYDEFGGQWGPRLGADGRQVGTGHPDPGPRPSAGMVKSGVDHTQYDTTSIIATIERSYDLAPVADRDARANDLASAGTVTRGDADRTAARGPPTVK